MTGHQGQYLTTARAVDKRPGYVGIRRRANLWPRIRPKKIKNFRFHIKYINAAPIVRRITLWARDGILKQAVLDRALVVTQPKDFNHVLCSTSMHPPGLRPSDVSINPKSLVSVVQRKLRVNDAIRHVRELVPHI